MTSPSRRKRPTTALKLSTKTNQGRYGCLDIRQGSSDCGLLQRSQTVDSKGIWQFGRRLLGLSHSAGIISAALAAACWLSPVTAVGQQAASGAGQFAASNSNRPVQESSIPRNQLRWRASQNAPVQEATPVQQAAPTQQPSSAVQQASYNAPVAPVGNGQPVNELALNEPGRLATHQEPAPIDDPFGDRQQTLQPPQQRSLGADQTPSIVNDADKLQWQSSGAGSSSRASAQPQSWSANQLPSSQASIRPIRRISQDQPVRTIDCNAARDILNGSPLTAIDLNVTPFRAEIMDEESGMVFRDQEKVMELIDSRYSARTMNQTARDWTDVNGNVIGSGWFYQVRNHQVTVRDASGAESYFVFQQLSAQDQAYVLQEWDLPSECPPIDEYYVARQWIPQTFTWKASALCHKPLYFEDIQLERYGHTAGPFLQPIKSGAHFFANIAILPYNMGINPPTECSYALGFYRPGDCAPWLVDPLPLSLRGAMMQAGVATGAAFAFP